MAANGRERASSFTPPLPATNQHSTTPFQLALRRCKRYEEIQPGRIQPQSVRKWNRVNDSYGKPQWFQRRQQNRLVWCAVVAYALPARISEAPAESCMTEIYLHIYLLLRERAPAGAGAGSSSCSSDISCSKSHLASASCLRVCRHPRAPSAMHPA